MIDPAALRELAAHQDTPAVRQALEAAAQRIEALEAAMNDALANRYALAQQAAAELVGGAQDEIARLKAERDALKDAVKPFVEAIRWSKIGFLHLDIGKITTEDLRIARRTMENSND